MRLGKTLLIVAGAVLGILVIAVVSFFVFFPKQQAVALVERQIEEATGRDLTLAGDVDLTFFPALGFSARQASLSNPHGFSEAPFLAADRIVFAVAVLPLLTGHIEVKQLIFEGADLRLEAKPDGTANWTFPTEETPQHQTTIDDLKLGDVRMIRSRISFQGDPAQPPLTLENVDARLNFDTLDLPARVEASFDHNSEHVDATTTIGLPRAVMEQKQTPLSLDFRSAPAHVTFQGQFNSETGALAGDVSASGDSLRRALAWAGSPLPDGSGFGAYDVRAHMEHEDETTALTNATMRLDAIEAGGSLNINAPAGGKLNVTGALTSPSIDLNPYLPAPSQGAGSAGVQASTAWSNDAIDLTGLRAIDADLRFSTPLLKFQKMTFSNVQMELKVARGAADARLTHITLYGGSGTAHLIADGGGAEPRIGVEIDARNINGMDFLRDSIGFDKIEGHGRVLASLAGEGRSQAAIMRSLHGTSSFQFTDGAFKGVDLGQMARIVSSLQGRPPPASGANATGFSEMAANFAVTHGTAATDNLRLTSPVLRLDGSGMIDIGAQTIDMRIEPHAVNTQHAQTADAVLGVPFRVSGAWARPSFAPMIGEAVQNELRNRARALLQHQDQGSPLSALGNAIFGPGGAQNTSTSITTTSTATAAPASTTSTSTSTTTNTSTSTTRTPQQMLNDLFGHH